jgi:hypothetical protein
VESISKILGLALMMISFNPLAIGFTVSSIMLLLIKGDGAIAYDPSLLLVTTICYIAAIGIV